MTTHVKCLLVDDLEDNLLVLQHLLRADDVELLLARSGVEALNLLLEHEVALALVDVQMPEMDGFELAELMRGSARTKDVPIIFVTAGVRDQHRVFRGYESGAVDFLYKPVDPVILKNKAEVFFQLYRQKRQIAHELQVRTETLRLNEMFSAVLGHDLRSPLQAITSAAYVIRKTAADEIPQQAAAQIVRSSQRMTRMIADLLDLSRARLGSGIPVSPVPGDLAPIVERIVEEQQHIHHGRRLELSITGDTHAPVDPDRIAQALANLVGNALQHGAPDAPVRVVVTGLPEAVQVTVDNDGAIEESMLQRIFDPFRAGAERASSASGLGLGLYIAQQIVCAHGGEITVDVIDGRQTSFRVLIPRSNQ